MFEVKICHFSEHFVGASASSLNPRPLEYAPGIEQHDVKCISTVRIAIRTCIVCWYTIYVCEVSFKMFKKKKKKTLQLFINACYR